MNRKTWETHLRQIAISLGLTLATIVILEASLRLWSSWIQPSPLATPAILNNQLRILAIGESTTADYFSADSEGAWPRRLERSLNKQGIDTLVFNEGLGGTNSPLILTKLDDWIEKYKPHLVISMMGVNDNESLLFQEKLMEGSFSFDQVRTFRVLKWLISEFALTKSCVISERDIAPQETKPVEGDDKELKALRLAHLSQRAFEASQYDQARKFSDEAFALFPRNRKVAFWKLSSNLASPESMKRECAPILTALSGCGSALPHELIAKISNCHTIVPNEVKEIVKSVRGLHLQIESQSTLTAHHYRLLYSRLHEKGIALIAMQYPTLPVESLKAFFQDNEGEIQSRFGEILFVSNRENFQVALKEKKYDEIFIDRFAKTWGHTSGFGHQLIADAAEKVVLPWISTKAFLKK